MLKYFHVLLFAICLQMLTGCTTDEQPADIRYGAPEARKMVAPTLKPSRQVVQNTKDPRNVQLRSAGKSLATAATSPLEDLNIRKPIAPRALADLAYIYEANPRPSCHVIARELFVLQRALGETDADDDAIELSKRQARNKLAADTTLDVVRSTSSGLIPFSGVVRTASGARQVREQYDSHFDAGRRRRAFLKGYALGIGCPAPTSPRTLIAPKPEPDPEYREPVSKPVKGRKRKSRH